MDKIILGILMLRRLTSYELRGIIRQNYKSMCSDSLGTIQATLKKLFEGGFISCNEFVEKSVNKKMYSITDTGRACFMEWLKTPADMTKGKNMELGKLLLMGLVPEAERAALIDGCIAKLQGELSYLEEIQKAIQSSDEKPQFLAHMEQDAEYTLGVQKATNNPSIAQNVEEIALFESLTLQLGIDTAKFQMEWFQSLKTKIQAREMQQ